CDGSPLPPPLGSNWIANSPNFAGRYPRGFMPNAPDLLPGESGGLGTTIEQRLLSHSHTYVQDIERFSHGNDETGPVVNPRPNHNNRQTEPNLAGGSENRPHSVVLNFFIRVR